MTQGFVAVPEQPARPRHLAQAAQELVEAADPDSRREPEFEHLGGLRMLSGALLDVRSLAPLLPFHELVDYSGYQGFQ